MQHQLKLASNFSMPAVDYAGQGNAILGIRDAGKTYTAMKAAELLLDAGIPIIVYDPVGVWRNLKNGKGNNKGYPVVIAGGEGSDIKLNELNAVSIVGAAMKENISLVIDLYSPELINKSKWIRIVQETIDLLMYENKSCGLRHIFIEEAAEFIPQRLQPQHSKVYASIERLARMGRNARLGYTLINQRAEEVNKAILEISALSLLHKQVGKNSIASVQKWLELMQVQTAKDIVKSLPALMQGECWAIGMAGEPKRIKISERKTFHPDPKSPQNNKTFEAKSISDVSSFVDKLNRQLIKTEKPAITISKANSEQVESIKKELQATKDLLHAANRLIDSYKQKLTAIQKAVSKELSGVDHIVSSPPTLTIVSSAIQQEIKPKKVDRANVPIKKIGKCAHAILLFLATYMDRSFTKAQIGVYTGYSPNSGGFNNALSELNTQGLISRENSRVMINRVANLNEWTGDFTKQHYSLDTFKSKLGKCEREIYDVLLNNPSGQFTKEELAARTITKYSHSSGGFNNALSSLNTLELTKRTSGLIQLNPELAEL